MHSFVLFFLFLLSSHSFSSDIKNRVVVISDFNGSYGSVTYGSQVATAIKKVIALNPDLVISTGDMVAGQKAGLNYEAMWSAFHEVVTLPLQDHHIPFAVTVGNHDGSAYPKYNLERDIFISQWLKFKPSVMFLNDHNYPTYYSFELNDMLFISIDTTLVGPIAEKQYLFLKEQLALNMGKKYKFIFTHVPMFQFNQDSINESFFDAKIYDLIQEYNVQFYLTGHQHTYYPGYLSGTHYISQACLGAGMRKLIGMDVVSSRSITVIDFYDSSYEIYALTGPSFDQRVDHSILPKSISSKNKTIYLKDRSDK
jgi:hypothetical protein